MRRVACALLVLAACLPRAARLERPSLAPEASREWTNFDTAMEAGVALTLAADWSQTAQISRWRGGWHGERAGGPFYRYPMETNPILGPTPSLAAVGAYFSGCIAAHAAVAYLLPKPYRTAWQASWLGVELYTVGRNFSAGIGVAAPW